MNPDLQLLQPYPFEKLQNLKKGILPPEHLPPIVLSIGAPKHPAPTVAKQSLIEHIDLLDRYPTIKGLPELREAIGAWLMRRYALPETCIDANRHILPVNGTREALFAIAQTVVAPRHEKPLVLMPNPFYQIYEGAAFLAHAQPVYLNCTEEHSFIPDFEQIPKNIWAHCQLLYLCTPGNPAGAVMPQETFDQLINLADQYNFVIVSDECYSEIYPDEQRPPIGLLQAAYLMGNTTFEHCLMFNSLSKRSNLPGLRSGFVAGHADLIEDFYQYRTYQGCTLPTPTQYASLAAWCDEAHVVDNRVKYREKFSKVIALLSPLTPVSEPDAGFYLWLKTSIDDTEFAKRLYQSQNVTVLPGSYLSRDAQAVNPGKNYVRLALVDSLDACIEAAHRIKNCLTSL